MTDWENHYQTANVPWDKGGAHPGLLATLHETPLHGRILVPGCGLGHDIQAIAEAGGVKEITGLDIAPSAVSAARTRLTGIGPAAISVEEADLFALPRSFRQAYHWVWEHTCFCAIPVAKRNAYVNAVADCLRPGGHLLAVFYLNPWDPGEDQTQGPPFGTSLDELDARFAPRFEIIRTWAPAATYPGREHKEIMRLLRKS